MTVSDLIKKSGMTIKQFSDYFNISYRTVQDWNCGKRKCTDYLIALMYYKLIHEGLIEE